MSVKDVKIPFDENRFEEVSVMDIKADEVYICDNLPEFRKTSCGYECTIAVVESINDEIDYHQNGEPHAEFVNLKDIRNIVGGKEGMVWTIVRGDDSEVFDDGLYYRFFKLDVSKNPEYFL